MSKQREVLYAADVAELRGISVRAARGWLAGLEHEAGSSVRRVGGKLCITRRGLEQLVPGAQPVSPSTMDGRFRRLHAQVQAIARVVVELREQMTDLAEGLQSARLRLYSLSEQHSETTQKSTAN